MVSWHVRLESYFVHMDRGRKSTGSGTHQNLSLQISSDLLHSVSVFSFAANLNLFY
jgi:hypothetical protein